MIPERRRKELLKGNRAHLCSLEEIASRAGIELRIFKLMWKFMSAHVHALPLSFYRMAAGERGRGVQTPVEEAYTKLTISFALMLLVGAREEYVRLVESAGPLERMVSYAPNIQEDKIPLVRSAKRVTISDDRAGSQATFEAEVVDLKIGFNS
jgi:hypothetical protein